MTRVTTDSRLAGGAAHARQPLLEVTDPQNEVTRVPLHGHLLIGRSPDAGLRLDGGTVSRHHAEIFRDPFGRWWVRDLGSRNGIRFNGQKVPERLLQPGSTFHLGHYRLTFRGPVASEPATNDIDWSTSGSVILDDNNNSHLSTLEDANRPRISGDLLSALMRFGRELLDIEKPAERLGALCRLMVSDDFKGNCAMVFRVSRTQDTPPMILLGPLACARESGEPPSPYISRSLVRHLRKTACPVLASNLGRVPEAVEMSIAPGGASVSAVACPLAITASLDEFLDVLYVTLPPQYGTGEWLAVTAVAAEQHRLAEIAWEARKHAQAHALTEQELQRARQIQLRLVPRALSVPGVDIAVGFEPCRWVGGDYVDVTPAEDGRLLLAVADVCGKGMPAALIATSLRTMIRTSIRAGVRLPELITTIRPQLGDCVGEDSFITMVGISLDAETGAMLCINAGHPAPFVVSPDGTVRELPCAVNFPLGVMVEPIECRNEKLASGELLVMFTDGISELADPAGEMLGAARFAAEVAAIYTANAALSASELVKQIALALDGFRGGCSADDDQTFLLAKRA